MRFLIAVAAVALLACASAEDLASAATLSSWREALLSATNAAREQQGLPGLEPRGTLALAAQAHAEEMAELAYFSHASPVPEHATLQHRLAEAGDSSVTAAENLASLSGYADPVQAAVDGWLASPGHRRNLLGVEYTHVGFGVATTAAGETLVVQVLAGVPRRLLHSGVRRVTRQRYDVELTLLAQRPATVLAALGGSKGTPREVAPGTTVLTLSTDRADPQQLLVGAAMERGDIFLAQAGGWVATSAGSFRPDRSMPEGVVAIEEVEVTAVVEEVIEVRLAFEAEGGDLQLFVGDEHRPGARVGPGEFRTAVPVAGPTVVRVGEAEGDRVRIFAQFTVTPQAGGAAINGGAAP